MPRRRQFPTTTLAAAAAAALLPLALAPAPAARADISTTATTTAPAPTPVPSTELRLLAGVGGAAEVAQSLLDHHLRLELGIHGVPKSGWAEGAVLLRFLGSPDNGLWLRAGAFEQRVQYTCGGVDSTDRATAFDGGLAYRHRRPSGALFVAEAGLERLTRPDTFICEDSVLSGASSGKRVSVAGQIPITSRLGFYGRFGFRSAAHIKEIGILPELWLGLAFEL